VLRKSRDGGGAFEFVEPDFGVTTYTTRVIIIIIIITHTYVPASTVYWW